MACLGLVTFFPLRPDRSLPSFISCISRSTALPAAGLYLRELEDFFDELFFAELADDFLAEFLDELFFAELFFDELFLAELFFFVAIGRSSTLGGTRPQSAGLPRSRQPVSSINNHYRVLSDAISITNRYFTSALITRSNASLIL